MIYETVKTINFYLDTRYRSGGTIGSPQFTFPNNLIGLMPQAGEHIRLTLQEAAINIFSGSLVLLALPSVWPWHKIQTSKALHHEKSSPELSAINKNNLHFTNLLFHADKASAVIKNFKL